MGRVVALALLLILSGPGCGPEVDAELIPVHSVRPRLIEPGTRIEIAGAGFPVGRDAVVRFEGELRAPGAAPRDVRVSVRGRVVAADRVELVAGERLVSALGGRGTFAGAVIVVFEGHGGSSRVRGTLGGATLDVSPSLARQLDEDVDRAREARAVVERIGITFADEPPAAGGLEVEAVRRASPAARAGVRPRDRVIDLDGMSLLAPSDFLPAPGAERVVLRVARGGEAAPVEAVVEVQPRIVALAPEEIARTAVPIAALVLVLVFLAPTARAFEEMERAVRRALRGRARVGLSLRESWLALGTLVVIAAALGPDVVRERIDAVSIVLLAVVAQAAVRAAAMPAAGGARWRATVAHGLRAVADAVPVLAAALAAALASGSVRLEGLVEAQGGAPWTWNAFRTPVLAGLAVLFVRRALGAPAGLELEHETALASRVVGRARLLAMSVVAAVAFFGGWHVPGWEPVGRAAGDPVYLATAAGVLVIKAWLIALIAARVRPATAAARSGLGGFAREAVAPALGVVGLALSAGVAALDPPRTVEALSAAATFLTAGTVTLVALARAALGRSLDPAPIVHPFA